MVNLLPVQAIEGYSGIRNGNIKANFYSDCTMIPDPSELNEDENNLLILDDCFLGPQSKAEAYYTIIATPFIYHKIIFVYPARR